VTPREYHCRFYPSAVGSIQEIEARDCNVFELACAFITYSTQMHGLSFCVLSLCDIGAENQSHTMTEIKQVEFVAKITQIELSDIDVRRWYRDEAFAAAFSRLRD
jgi:hypothetical protein